MWLGQNVHAMTQQSSPDLACPAPPDPVHGVVVAGTGRHRQPWSPVARGQGGRSQGLRMWHVHAPAGPGRLPGTRDQDPGSEQKACPAPLPGRCHSDAPGSSSEPFSLQNLPGPSPASLSEKGSLGWGTGLGPTWGPGFGDRSGVGASGSPLPPRGSSALLWKGPSPKPEGALAPCAGQPGLLRPGD